MIESFQKVIEACHREGGEGFHPASECRAGGNAKNAGAPIKAASSICTQCGKRYPADTDNGGNLSPGRWLCRCCGACLEGRADAVEVHMAHGYLVNSFLSPRTNKRVDEFGGCFENRMRFPRLIIEKIRERVGDRIAVLARINSS